MVGCVSVRISDPVVVVVVVICNSMPDAPTSPDAVAQPLYKNHMEAQWHSNTQNSTASAHRWAP